MQPEICIDESEDADEVEDLDEDTRGATALRRLAGVLLVLLTPFAWPYRAVMFGWRTFPGFWRGLLAWAGVVVAFWFFYSPWAEHNIHVLGWVWLALLLSTLIHTWVKWYSVKPRRDEGVSHCPFGRWEPAAALVLAVAMHVACGMGTYFAAGYAASVAQIRLVRLRRRLEAWEPEDTERLVASFRTTAGRGAAVAKQGALAVAPLGAAVVRGAKTVAGRGASNGPASPAARPPSFMGRVMSHMVASFLLSTLMGGFSIWGVFKVLGMACAFLLSTIGGYHVEAPESIRQEVSGFRGRAREYIRDKEGAMKGQWEAGKDRAMDRLEEEKGELKEEFGRRKRGIVRDLIFGS